MPWPWRVNKVVASVLGTKGTAEVSLRKAVFDRVRLGKGPVPADLTGLLDKIAESPWTVTDADISSLKVAGYSEDQLYEIVLAAATGAGIRRLDAGLRAMEGEQ